MTLFKHIYGTVCAQDKNPLFQNRNQPEYRDSRHSRDAFTALQFLGKNP